MDDSIRVYMETGKGHFAGVVRAEQIITHDSYGVCQQIWINWDSTAVTISVPREYILIDKAPIVVRLKIVVESHLKNLNGEALRRAWRIPVDEDSRLAFEKAHKR